MKLLNKIVYYGVIATLSILMIVFMVRIYHVAKYGIPDRFYSVKEGGWVSRSQELGWGGVDKQFKLEELGDLPLPVGLSYDRATNTVRLILDRPATDKEKQKLANYFKMLLNISRRDMWINLKRYSDEISSLSLMQSAMGCDLVAADYLMKLVCGYYRARPDFANHFTEMADRLHGRSDFDPHYVVRTWIDSADAALVIVNNGACITKADLVVQCEIEKNKDYASSHEMANAFADTYDFLLIKYIAPQVQYQVRNNLSFTTLRQIYRCLMLADWLRIEYPVCTRLVGSMTVEADTNIRVCVDIKTLYQKIYDKLDAFRSDRIAYNEYRQRRIETSFTGGIMLYKKSMQPETAQELDKDVDRALADKGIKAGDEVSISLSEPVTTDEGEHLWKRYSDGKGKGKVSIKIIERPDETGGLEF